MATDTPPCYIDSCKPENPPAYCPSVQHLSLVYFKHELPYNLSTFIPLLFEINSTQINLYAVKDSKYITHLFEDLNPVFQDPNLNIKSSKVSKPKTTFSSSPLSFNIFDPPPLVSTDSEASVITNTSFNSIFSSSNSSSASVNSQPMSSISSSSASLSKFFNKLSLKKQTKQDTFSPLTLEEKHSQDYIYITKLINHKPDINAILDTDYTPQDAQLLNFKSYLYKSYSLQELMKFGNASDFHSKPFALRLIFAHDQFMIVSYNAHTYASIFYKLNVARELSLDFNLRTTLPLNYCVPRRSSARRNRGSSVTSLRSNNSTGRRRSNSLLDDNADGDDELDTTFDDSYITYQPQQQQSQPQIILEDEILDDIIQLEPAEQTISSMSFASRMTSNSVFSSVERFSSQVTTTSSLVNSSTSQILEEEEPEDTKIPVFEHPQDKYKELVVAVKCIKSCKNKTIALTH